MDLVEKTRFKDELFEQFARIGKALSSGRRLELVELLAQAEPPVEDLAAETGQSVANTSQHLQVTSTSSRASCSHDSPALPKRCQLAVALSHWNFLPKLNGRSKTLEQDQPICAGHVSAEIGRKIALPRFILLRRRNPDRNSKTYHLHA
jgi:hypothetical protein